MNTAQRILTAHKTDTAAQARAMESEARDLAVKVSAANCFERTWTFYDGSTLSKHRDGYSVVGAK